MHKYILFISIVLFTACTSKNSVKLTGKFENPGTASKVFLYEQQVAESRLLDSAKLSKSGEFNFRIKLTEPRFFQLRIGKSGMLYLLLSPGEKLSLEANVSNLNSSTIVKGSAGTDLILGLNNRHASVMEHLDSLRTEYKNLLQHSATKEQLAVLENDYLQSKEKERKNAIRFIIENYKSMASIMALYLAYDSNEYVLQYPKDLQYYKIVSDSLHKLYPASRYVKALKSDFENMMKMHRSEITQNLLKNAKVSIPEIALPNLKGDTIRISKFMGKVIILSFWSYDSKECLMLNRDYLEVYKKFKNSGLVIYQVSEDRDKEKWREAVSGFPWISVAELTGPYYARLYNVSNLPANYLINQNGDIAGKNLNASELEKQISGLIRK